MDNLTHSLTGLLLSRAGGHLLTPRATWIAVLAANIPDADAVSILGGTETYFAYHRWATHAIAFTPLTALLPVLLVAAISRQRLPWFRAWLLSLAAIASHLLLDFTNPYGIRLFLPFSSGWPSLDITHVIDVWIWAILLIGALWPMLSGLVGSEIGAKSSRGQGLAIAALLLVALYDTGRYFLHQRAVQTLESRVYDGSPPQRALVFPGNVNPMRWDGWVRTGRAWLKLNVDLSREFDPQPVATYWDAESGALTEIAARLPVFRQLEAFAKTPSWRVSPAGEPSGANRVELIDLRFGRGSGQGFTAEAIIDSNRQVLRSSFHF